MKDLQKKSKGFKSGMGDRDWRPFVYGGLASCVAEFGKQFVFIFICELILGKLRDPFLTFRYISN